MNNIYQHFRHPMNIGSHPVFKIRMSFKLIAFRLIQRRVNKLIHPKLA